MRALSKFVFTTLALCFLLSSGISTAENISDVEKNLSQQKSDIAKLKKKLSKLKVEQNKQNKALQATSRKVSNARKQLQKTQKSLSSTQNKLSQLREQNREITRELNKSKQDIQTLLIAVYKNQDNNQLKLLLSEESPQKLSRLLKYHQYLQQEQLDKIQVHLKTLEKFKQNEQALTAELVNLQSLKKAQQQEQDDLSNAKKLQQQQLAELKRSVTTESKRLEKKQKDQQRLNKLLSDMKKALEDINALGGSRPFKSDKGKMPWPVKGRIMRSFGSALAGGKLKSNGILIGAPSGRAVKAIHSGRIVFADWFSGFGLLTIIDHGDGYMSLYGQAESVVREPGEWINRGDVIAYAGNTSDTDIEGIYFEIRKQGTPINPKRWCTGRP
ncbi:murein hydrolase activator EnvC family protein [Litoribrevibacter euphylliae]|uniref:Murein hydrolase activator EnvC family protein n=1 Tax=Litoribrevibacter euphylliae TaxID=1834034 RepID=A0ABV7HHX9_9GAMM